ncbi:Aminopeptidase M1-C [Nymphon striatum]|nr:Aminopeptidase M1-C [Nymphon striatum]
MPTTSYSISSTAAQYPYAWRVESINQHRLPRTISPTEYQVRLRPDIGAAAFSGSVTISATADQAVSEIVLNSIELTISEATIRQGDVTQTATVRLDDDTERLHLTVDSPIAAGEVQIDISFDGILNDKLHGFYRSTFTDEAGVEHTIATTQFSTNARRCFPCWDEPDRKAVFRVTLEVPGEMLAITAMVDYAPTPLMSTYLLAFMVGEMEASPTIDVDGVPLRVIHRPGQGDQIAFAQDAAVFCLRWLTDYFGVPYFGDKIDLLAIPDFAFGAMENTGCVTFREVLLLLSHELAHMWFGNLVTMQWWEGLWLKEAFATFMETFAVERSAAYHVDCLHSTRAIEFVVESPADAEGMYDVLTYEKGASVVRMLEQFVGPDKFRDGIRNYMSTHAYGNTVDGVDDRVLMTPQARVQLDSDDVSIIVDPHGHGFFRVRYDAALSTRLADGLMDLTAGQRHRLFDDQFDLVLAGQRTVADYVSLAQALHGETTPPVWSTLSSGFSTIAHASDSRDAQAMFAELWAQIAGPQLAALGYDRADGEDALVNEVRASLYSSLGSLSHDQGVLDHARQIFDGSLSTTNASIESAATRVVASTGSRADYDEVFARFRGATSPQAERRYMFALSRFDDASAIADLCDRTLDGSIRNQDAAVVLGLALANRWHGHLVWSFITDNWERISEAMPENAIGRMLSGVEWLEHGDVPAVHSFLTRCPKQSCRSCSTASDSTFITDSSCGSRASRLRASGLRAISADSVRRAPPRRCSHRTCAWCPMGLWPDTARCRRRRAPSRAVHSQRWSQARLHHRTWRPAVPRPRSPLQSGHRPWQS